MYLGQIVELAPRDGALRARRSTRTRRRCSRPRSSRTRSCSARGTRVVLEGDIPSPLDAAVGLPLPHALPARAASRRRGRTRRSRRSIDVGDGPLRRLPPRRRRRATTPQLDRRGGARVVMPFTTRPELRGTFGMVASTHWLASAAGMAVLERGGNAFDAAVAAGLHAAGRRAAPERPGRRPARGLLAGGARRAARALRPGRRAGRGDDRALPRARARPRPGHRACSPRACRARSAAGCSLLRDSAPAARATCSRSRSATPSDGYPVVAGITRHDRARRGAAARVAGARPSSTCPRREPGDALPQPALAATYRRLVDESRGGSREDGDRARARASSTTASSPRRSTRFSRENGGLLDRRRPARLARDARGAGRRSTTAASRCCKTGPWGQGPVVPAAARAARRLRRSRSMSDGGARPHRRSSARSSRSPTARRCTATRSPTCRSSTLLSRGVQRRAPQRSSATRPRRELRPGRRPPARTPRRRRDAVSPASASRRAATPCTSTSPTASATSSRRRRAAAGCRARRSIPALGWPLGTRAQMFWLEDGLPTSLEPRTRPRTTLSPTLVAARTASRSSRFGTPGGDQQDQWALHVFLAPRRPRAEPAGGDRRAGLPHRALPDSFYPARGAPRSLLVEERARRGRRRASCGRAGTTSTVTPPWSLGRVSAVARDRTAC